MTYSGPKGVRTGWQEDPELPVEGSIELDIPVERLWQIFRHVRLWARWNRSIWMAGVTGGQLAEGEQLVWAFQPIRPEYLYKLPVTARLVDMVPERRLTWQVTILPGMHARHTYWMEPISEARCRFGSWEVAEGPLYRLLRPFWLAPFRFVRDESLAGARHLPPAPATPS